VTVVLARFIASNPVPLRDIAYLGSILPGIAAYNLYRIDREKRVADVAGSIVLVVGLVLLAAVVMLSRSVLLGPSSVETVVITAEQLVFGNGSPTVSNPAPVIPRAAVVGLFVFGLLINEGIRKRYGLRLAGIIAVPLMAVFTLQDVRLLALYIAATAVGTVFVWLVHGTTFVYGRSLLGGTCTVCVVVAVLAVPLLSGEIGLRPLIIGLLAGVTTYNGHVLAPSERVRSVALNIGTFVGLFALVDTVAFALNRPFFFPPTVIDVAFGLALLGTAGYVLFECERRRPDQPIETVANGEATVVPDGGMVREHDVVPDAGASDPLAGRRVTRIGPNAQLVYRDRQK